MATITETHLYAGTPNSSRGEPTHISADPTGNTDNIVYPSGRVAVIRSISAPMSARVFSAHTASVSCATFSPDASLVASGDTDGVIRFWNPDTALQFKAEAEVMPGTILDISFDPSGKFLVCTGDCRGAFAKVIKVPSGGSAGVCQGHTKRVLACDVGKGVLATGSEDMSVGLFKGPPVREIDTPEFLRHHAAFVNDVRFSPDGKHLAMASSDRTVTVLEVAKKEVVLKLEGHAASVTGLSWVRDGQKLLTSSNDKTTKIWNIPSGECLSSITYGKDVMDMQIGCALSRKGGEIVSVSLRPEILICDEGADTPKMVLRGHSKQIVGLAAVGSKIYTADYSGLLVAWEEGRGASDLHFNGKGPSTSVCAIAANAEVVASVGLDGKVFITQTSNLTYGKPVTVKGGGVDIAVPVDGCSQFSAIMVNETRLVAIDIAGETAAAEMKIGNGQTGASCAVTSDGSLIAVGIEVSGGAGELHFYSFNGSSFAVAGESMRMPSAPNRIAFSPDDDLIAIGEKSRRVRICSVSARDAVTGGGVAHTARVDGICFSPDGGCVASGGMDGSVVVWPVNSEDEPIKLKTAHRNGVTGIAFTSPSTIVTSGGDSCVRGWTM